MPVLKCQMSIEKQHADASEYLQCSLVKIQPIKVKLPDEIAAYNNPNQNRISEKICRMLFPNALEVLEENDQKLFDINALTPNKIKITLNTFSAYC